MPIEERLSQAFEVMSNPGFAHAVTVTGMGRIAFVSGQVAMNVAGDIVGEDDLRTQTRQAMRNLQNVLASLNAGWADVVKLGRYVIDASQVQVIRDVRDEFLRPALGCLANPASTLIQVAALFRPELLVEVDAVVAVA